MSHPLRAQIEDNVGNHPMLRVATSHHQRPQESIWKLRVHISSIDLLFLSTALTSKASMMTGQFSTTAKSPNMENHRLTICGLTFLSTEWRLQKCLETGLTCNLYNISRVELPSFDLPNRVFSAFERGFKGGQDLICLLVRKYVLLIFGLMFVLIHEKNTSEIN